MSGSQNDPINAGPSGHARPRTLRVDRQPGAATENGADSIRAYARPTTVIAGDEECCGSAHGPTRGTRAAGGEHA